MVVDDEFVEAVEDQMSHARGAWDMVNHTELCEAVIKVYVKRLRERVIEREKMSPLDTEHHDLVQSS